MRADIITQPRLREVARKVEQITDGAVAFAYATVPDKTVFYVFDVTEHDYDPPHERMTLREVLDWLGEVLALARARAT